MSSKESRKNMDIKYKGTINPVVGGLMNKCRGMGKEFRILSEHELDREQKSDRMTIIVDPISGDYIRHFWG
jgi:hypothetical protein